MQDPGAAYSASGNVKSAQSFARHVQVNCDSTFTLATVGAKRHFGTEKTVIDFGLWENHGC